MNAAPVPPYAHDSVKTRPIQIPRPGHVDFAGGLKLRTLDDMRNVLERASARETTMRVAVGAVARRLLEECGIAIGSHIIELGGVKLDTSALSPQQLAAHDLNERVDSFARALSGQKRGKRHDGNN